MAGTTPRGVTRRQIDTMYNPGQQSGVKTATKPMDGIITEEVIKIGDVISKLTVQASGTLVCDVTVSVNGSDFITALLAVDSSTPVTYEDHNVTAIKVTRTAGTGQLHIAGKV